MIMFLTVIFGIFVALCLCMIIGLVFILKESESPWAKKMRLLFAGKNVEYTVENGYYTFCDDIIDEITSIHYRLMVLLDNTNMDREMRDIRSNFVTVVEFSTYTMEDMNSALEIYKKHRDNILASMDYKIKPDINYISTEIGLLALKLAQCQNINQEKVNV